MQTVREYVTRGVRVAATFAPMLQTHRVCILHFEFFNIPQTRHRESSTTTVRPAPLTQPPGAPARGHACSRGDSATNRSTASRRTTDMYADAATTRRSSRTLRTDGGAAV